MKIVGFNVFSYSLPLRQPLRLKNITLFQREGMLIKLTDEKGYIGWGEIAPLPGFSQENLSTAKSDVLKLKTNLTDKEIPTHFLPLNDEFEKWLRAFHCCPSVRFGFEAAILNLIAVSKKTILSKILTPNPLDNIIVNGLLYGTKDNVVTLALSLYQKGYRAFKLKIGHLKIDDAIGTVKEVRKVIGDDSVLRLDANQSFNFDDAEMLFEQVASYNIDYIEEPVKDVQILRQFLEDASRNKTMPTNIALDETLLDITSDNLLSFPSLKAIVIKPTLLGLERAVRFAYTAQQSGITVVFSSSFESSLGIYQIASIAAGVCLDNKVAMGLDTLHIFKNDLCDPPLQITKGEIALTEDVDIYQRINNHWLKDIDDV